MTGHYTVSINFGISATGILFYWLLITGGANYTGHLWYYTFPLFSLFLLGSKRGTFATVILFLPSIIFLTADIKSPFLADYTFDFKIRFITSFAVVVAESQERFLMVLNSIDADVYVADMETYEIIFMNEHMVENFGADYVGEVCWKVFRNDGAPCLHCTNDKLLVLRSCCWTKILETRMRPRQITFPMFMIAAGIFFPS